MQLPYDLITRTYEPRTRTQKGSAYFSKWWTDTTKKLAKDCLDSMCQPQDELKVNCEDQEKENEMYGTEKCKHSKELVKQIHTIWMRGFE